MSSFGVGDEHWTKVLQANDALGKLPVCPYHGKKLPLRSAFNDDAKPTSVDDDPVAEPGDRPCRGRQSSSASAEDHSPGDVSSSIETKERTGLTTLFDRFCQWLSDARRQASLLRLPLPKSRSRRSSSLRRSRDDGRGRRPSRRHSRRRCNSASPSSSSHGDLNDPTMQRGGSGSRATSTCSSMTTATSTSTAGSDVIAETRNAAGDVVIGTGSTYLDASLPLQRRRVTSARSGNDVSAADVLQKNVGRCESNLKDECSLLISTWPSANGKQAIGANTHTYN